MGSFLGQRQYSRAYLGSTLYVATLGIVTYQGSACITSGTEPILGSHVFRAQKSCQIRSVACMADLRTAGHFLGNFLSKNVHAVGTSRIAWISAGRQPFLT